jgi:hypothetical protein
VFDSPIAVPIDGSTTDGGTGSLSLPQLDRPKQGPIVFCPDVSAHMNGDKFDNYRSPTVLLVWTTVPSLVRDEVCVRLLTHVHRSDYMGRVGVGSSLERRCYMSVCERQPAAYQLAPVQAAEGSMRSLMSHLN